ncbi:oxygen-independent coproporphyrinogen-3 oxidase [Ancylomarina subtilis]|uniref:Heme chaperone HemW n=1 Tax=Ancylomarina subtilis TaxID=1639035 RepID=A0A4Q7VN09_9BACT|nr:radical SAM family heme chaperone HemW [Ancylomarina subtilis]RZT97594.1 oxygen-independent coproporphyrinogen-3 oxidase [Ancylomarina subtilis]
MSGIYFHIPFCKQLCHYCAFHKSISLQAKERMLVCLKKELNDRKNYLSGSQIDSIYFGGGTPSVYSPEEIQSLILEVGKHFIINKNAEITLEANPDDLTHDYLKDLKETSVNRLSVGIQSFHDEDLILMNRRHTGQQAYDAIKRAQTYGFDNISVDQIYGVPGLSLKKWEENLEKVFELNIQHISSYHLMYDPNTVFTHKLKKGIIKELNEDISLAQYKHLISEAKKHGFLHYEISNFSQVGLESKHNSSYWQQKMYLGLGPSAHSYNLDRREWNISDNLKYMKAVEEGGVYSEYEELSFNDRFNDYVLTSLRTMWGLDLDLVKREFGESYYQYCQEKANKFIQSEDVRIEKEHIILTDKGVFISNDVMSDFFFIEE